MYITPLTQMTHYNQQLNCDNDTHMYITPLTQMTHYNQQLNCDNAAAQDIKSTYTLTLQSV